MINVSHRELLERAKKDMIRSANRISETYSSLPYGPGKGTKCEALMNLNNIHMKIDWINDELSKEE